jgi:hypothetical protein
LPPPEDEAVAPVSGAPLGTTETWAPGAWLGAAVGSALGTVLGSALDPVPGASLGTALGSPGALGTGLGVALPPSAKAGAAPVSTAAQASAATPRTVVRMDDSPCSVRPPVGRAG